MSNKRIRTNNLIQAIICPECGWDIGDAEFSVDSEVSGHKDMGYNCVRCKIDVYVYKVERMPEC